MTSTLSPPEPVAMADPMPDFEPQVVADLDLDLDLDLAPADDDGPSDEDAVVRLPAHGTTATADALRTALVRAADAGGAIRIDASEVESIGQATLQLLVAACAEALGAGHPFIIANASPAFVNRVTGCGLAETLGLSGEDRS